MTKNQKIILYGALGVFIALAALIIVLIVQNARHSNTANQLQEQADSLRFANDRLELANITSEFDRLNSELAVYEDKQLTLQNDSLVQQYNEAKERVNSLIAELEKEKRSNKANREKIKQLENEITTLKGIAKHYLEEIKRLNEENEGLRQELSTEKDRAENLARENATVSRSNAALERTVQLAKKLNISSLALTGYNDKGKTEKKLKKVKKFGVSFVVLPNTTASPGKKNYYVRIISPEGNLLGSGPAFSYDGGTVTSSGMRELDYDNSKENRAEVYCNVNSTLQPGDYSVEVFADGYRLGTGRFSLK